MLNHLSHAGAPKDHFKDNLGGAWVVQSVKCLPPSQLMISRSWDQALHQAPCSGEESASLFLSFSLSLSVSLETDQKAGRLGPAAEQPPAG